MAHPRSHHFRIGKWLALAQLLSGGIYLVLYVAILMTMTEPPDLGLLPFPQWSTMAAFADYSHSVSMSLLSALQVVTMFYPLLFLSIVVVLYQAAPSHKQFFGMLAVICSALFVGCTSVTYYIQFSSVRQHIHTGSLQGLDMFVMYNLHSPIMAVNMLGWMFFGGMASCHAGLLLGTSRLEHVIKWTWLAYGCFSILCAFLYAFGSVTSLLVWFGMMSAIGYVYLLLYIHFRRAEQIQEA